MADASRVRISVLDSDSKLILNNINEKLADLDQKLSFITEFLVYRFPDSGGFPEFVHEKATGDEPSATPPMPVTKAGKRAFVPTPAPPAKRRATGSATATVRSSAPLRMPNLLPRPPLPTVAASPLRRAADRAGAATAAAERADESASTSMKVEDLSDDDGGVMLDENDSSPATVDDDDANASTGDSLARSPALIVAQSVSLADADEASFPEEALRRAADKAAKTFEGTKPKVFAWQLLRESVTDEELRNVHISLRTFHGESSGDLLGRQLPRVRSVVGATLRHFGWHDGDADLRLAKTKLVLSHLKNNTKVRNWTLREGRPTTRNTAESLWKRYAAMLGPAGLAAAGLLPGHEGAVAPHIDHD